MAEPNIGQLVASAWESVMTPKPVNNIFTSQNLVGMLGKNGFKESSSGGRLFEETVEYAVNPTFKSYGFLEQLDTTATEVFDAARFEQKLWGGTVNFSDVEELRNVGEGKKFDIVKAKLLNGSNSALEGLNTMLYGDGTGNGGKDMDGLAKLISSTPTTGTVGGINAATWPFWRNRQNSGAKTTTAYDNLVSVTTTTWNQCTLGGTEMIPTGIISDRDTCSGFEAQCVRVERIVRDANGVGKADLGFAQDAIAFKGKPWIFDESCPTGTAYIVNNNYLKMTYLKGGWMKMKEPVEPADQFATIYRILTVAQLCTSARKYLGVVTAIT